MTEYSRVPTIKIARPDTPEGYMIINAADYRADLPQWMYEQGHAYDPAVWPPYVEQPLKAPAPHAAAAAADEPVSPASAPRHVVGSAARHGAAEEKK